MLALMQLVVSWSSRRWRVVERLVESEPVLLYHRGFQHGAMGRARVTQDESGGPDDEDAGGRGS